MIIATWSPLKVPGCALWFEADRGLSLSGANVTGIADQSGGGHNLSQADANKQLTLVAAQVNGRPILRCASATTEMTFTGWGNGVNEWDCFFVLNQTGTDGWRPLANASGLLLYMNAKKPTFFIDASHYQQWGSALTGFNIIRFNWNTTGWAMSVNNAAPLTQAQAITMGTWTKLFGGNLGDVAFGAIYPRILSDTEAGKLWVFLSKRFGISLV